MNDYKEICETLRLANSWQFAQGYVEAMLKAAEAIERLARDNNALTKERDSAEKKKKNLMHTYSGTVCFYCKHYNDRHCDDCVLGNKWQWRGVQEVDVE